jgi:hypothetical protein
MTKIRKKPVIDKDKLGINPLVANDFEILVHKVAIKNSYQTIDNILLPVEIDLEKESITKVYTKPMYREIVANCSSNGQRLYLWLLYEADSGLDYIWINIDRYMQENHITSINTYKKAIDELCRYVMIYPMIGYKHVYWLNPRLFFSGSRVNKYPDKIKRV